MAKWKNAPVFYVVAQVRFSPVLSLQTYVPQIQEHFRKNGFPSFAQRLNFQMGVVLPPPSDAEPNVPGVPFEKTTGYVFSNRDMNQSFVLEQNGLTFQVTEDYLDFSWFLDLFVRSLTVVHDAIEPDSVQRIGIRYLDAVIPRDGSAVRDYLIPEVTGLLEKSPEGSVQHAYSETMVQTDGTSTVSRVLVRNGSIALPPDLQSLPLKINKRFSDLSGWHAMIDTDSFQSEQFPMDISRIRTTLQHLHGRVDGTFRDVVTEFALEDWR